jgi:hypothetical protein
MRAKTVGTFDLTRIRMRWGVAKVLQREAGRANSSSWRAFSRTQGKPLSDNKNRLLTEDWFGFHSDSPARPALLGLSPLVETVEPVFGQIKELRGVRRFMQRGIEACRAEWRLHAAAHNLRKLWSSSRWDPPSDSIRLRQLAWIAFAYL